MPESSVRIEGEGAVVSAAGSGIGRQIAQHLIEAGVDVVANDVDPDALTRMQAALREGPGDIRTVAGDIADPAVAAETIERATSAFSGLDILVNNVGVAGPTAPCEDVTPEAFMDTLRTNLGGQFAPTREAIPHLRESEAGRVVNLSSVSGKRPLEHRTPYVTAKMGVIGFTRTLATELAPDGITVNAICPGSVEGPRIQAVIEGQAKSHGRSYEEVEREFREATALGEFVQAADIAELVVFLCSEQAAHITGQDLNVSAGKVMY